MFPCPSKPSLLASKHLLPHFCRVPRPDDHVAHCMKTWCTMANDSVPCFSEPALPTSWLEVQMRFCSQK